MWMMASVAALLCAYLLGSVSGSLLLGRLRGVDIRTQGSGNAGGTNALRTQGWKFALGTVLIDLGKGALAVWLAQNVFIPAPVWLPYAALFAAILGHVWPLFHGFRGGKGAGTLVGGLILLWPFALLPVLSLWLLCLGLSGYVGLATVLAALSLPLTALATAADSPRWLFAVATALLIVYTHRGNLARLRAGNENRFEKARLLHRLLARKSA
jgi:glycerol-3-phosphate acyltransferase PlsY